MQTPFRYRVTLIVTFLLIFNFTVLSFANSDLAFVKEKLVRTEKIWPGQRLTFYVTLYTTTSFSGSTRFELPKLSGMLIMENEDRPLIGSEKVDGLSYIFKRHEIVLFPLRPGSLTIPAFTVEFSFRGAAGNVIARSFVTQLRHFKVLEIPGVNPHNPVITTTDFQILDLWNPEPGQAQVGDALTRTITMSAEDLPGMAFPPTNLKKVPGLGFYSKPPQVEDRRQRGEFTGRRTEIITYICEQKGNFEIPGLTIQWWHPKTETLEKVSLKTATIEVTANPLLKKDSPIATDRTTSYSFPWKWTALFLLVLAIAGVGFLRYRSKKQLLRSNIYDNSEKEFWAKFEKAASSNDAAATMQALLNWLNHSKLTETSGTLAHFSDLASDPGLDKEIKSLETTLYATTPGKQWSGDKLYTAIQQARKKLNHPEHSEPHRLPALNP
ncbi:BatD family protein [bacterium]|nr:BatD family protein [bacterium]